MSDDQEFNTPRIGSDASASVPASRVEHESASAAVPHADVGPAPAPYHETYYPSSFDDDATGGIDLRRYVFVLWRYKWLMLLALLLGVGGASAAWMTADVTYTTQGNLWIEVESRTTNLEVAPIRANGLLESNAWIELLRSYQVLDTVAVREGLLIDYPEQHAPAFDQFELVDGFRPGSYELLVGETGDDFVLQTSEGVLVQAGAFGIPIGENIGMNWTPTRGSFDPGTRVSFSVKTARTAAQQLNDELVTRMDRSGNFLSLELSGSDPERIASILNTTMDRHVQLAAEIKSYQIEERLKILGEQLEAMQLELAAAERRLEEFRVNTISMPTDQSMPIAPGLQITRDPVFGSFFDMKVQVEQLSRDRARLAAIAADFESGVVRIEALEMVPAAAESSELRRILDELVDARSELRVLQERYEDDYGPIQDKMASIRGIEEVAIPRVVNGILSELSTRQREMEGYVSAAENELAQIPPRTIEEGRLDRNVTTTETLYNNLRGRHEAARLAAASSIPDVWVLDEARAPQRPSSDLRLPLSAAIFFGCLGLAVGAAILLDRMDSHYRYASDVSRDIGLDILGSVPRIEASKGRRGVINAAQALEAFRELRIHIGFAYGSAGPITVAITSPSEGEGKSLISSNLAVAFSEVGRRTLLIDGDTRRGDAHRLLGRQRSPGLVDYLRDRTSEDIIQPTDHPNLDFIGSGSRGVSTPELLASPRMAYFMGTLKRTYDVIIVDCPPLASGGDPLILGSLAGNLAVVIRTGSTEKALTIAKLDQLSRLPIRILGAILNDVSPRDSYHAYYASYLPSYEPVPEGDDLEGTQLLSGSDADDES